MSFNVGVKQTWRVSDRDSFGTGDKVTEFQLNTVKVTGASSYNKTFRSISAGLSNQEISLSPINASSPGEMILITSDQPIDIRFNSGVNSAIVSSVYQLFMINSNLISNLFVGVPGSTIAANLSVRIVRGGTISISVPLP